MVERPEPRKKSPRAPTIALDEALDRTMRIYEKDRLHPIPTDLAAKHMGYQSANNGSALQCLASLRYYGLLDRPKDGMVAVSKDVEAFKFAPDESLKKAFLRRFLSAPALFADLLDKAQNGMPSDENLRYDLINRGFIPSTAANVVATFKRSVEFSGVLLKDQAMDSTRASETKEREPLPGAPEPVEAVSARSIPGERAVVQDESDSDRIPVRLTGGRRAWIVIPAVFYARDKERLKAQIDLLLTQDDEDPH